MGNEIFKDYYNVFLNNKKFILLYLIAICVFIVLMFTTENWAYPTYEFYSIIFIMVLGSFLILYAFKNKDNIHNVAFVTIIIFGILMLIFTPPFIFADEGTHFTRAELITEGILIPHETSNGYLVQDYYFGLNAFRYGGTIFENPYSFTPISNHMGYWDFTTQTPFYAHILSALGVIIAKFFSLTAIGALWLARFANVLFYALIARYAIKKVSFYKIPMFIISCLPLLIAQISSVNYDAFIFTFAILAIAYFVYMFKNKVKNKDLIIFFISCLLMALIKPPYIALTLLVFFIPSENFTSKKFKWSMIVPVLILFGLTLTLSLNVFGFTTSSISQSSNGTQFSGQLNYILSSPLILLNVIWISLKSFFSLFIGDLTFFHYADYKGIKYYNLFYFIFFIGFSLLYPIKIKLSKNKRIFMILFLLLFYLGMYFIIYLEWNSIGASEILGVQARYFVPIIPLVPLAINFPFKKIKNIDLYTITFVIIFLAGLFLLPITHYY